MLASFLVVGAVQGAVGQGVSVDRQALIEQARRKARRRRIRNSAAVLLAAAAGAAAFIGSGGQDGGNTGNATQTPGGQSSAVSARSVPVAFPLAAVTDRVLGFAFDARAPDTVYVAANRVDDRGPVPAGGAIKLPTVEGGVYKSTDSGRHWRLTSPSGWPRLLTLAADPQRPGILYAGTERGIFKTIDGGRHWRALSRWPLPSDDYSLAVDPADSRVVYASSGSGISRSSDGGRTWKTVFRAFGSSGSAFAIAPTSPEVVYALEGNGGPHSMVIASANGGKTWRQPVPLHAPAPDAAGPDGGAAFVVDPENPTTLYAAVGSAVLKSTDAGRSWRSIARGLPPNVAVSSLAADPRHTGILYAALGGDGIFKTTDGGRTWDQHWFPIISVDMLAFNSAHPSTIYAGVSGTNFTAPAGTSPEPRILRSTNNGRTWPPAG